MSILIHPSYFPSIAQMIATVQADQVVFEVEDNYQKQTYRNRAHIAHANGKLLLNVPIKHSKSKERQKTKEVVVEDNFQWQVQHWKSLQSAYRTSPFFEYYEDDIYPLFHNSVSGLMDHNLAIFEMICELLGADISIQTTSKYEKETPLKDLRFMIESKKEKEYPLATYTQVHEKNHGFLPNLSILDLLFNEGPNALTYLESQQLEF
ncbi:WbqC family protein [Aureisphaera galaxeae]|uniref:WbqC family protein n=1 Tax=Aureisphaera galaxeae TaxID=1538023 RepID=UPI002350DB2B|nr:WbqC family protein [Aureisphaera galaxeae]MDC8003486.1 WbqC family protein [Aureisphaera galaxeae]